MSRSVIILDTGLVKTLGEIIEGKSDRFTLLTKKWGGVGEFDIDVLFGGVMTSDVIRYCFKYYEEMIEIKDLKREIKSMKFKLKEFYGVKSDEGESWDYKYDKAKSISLRLVIASLIGVDNFKYNIKCPMHKDKGPSMKVYDNSFYCFSCGSGGSVIDFVQSYKGFEFKETVQFLSNNF